MAGRRGADNRIAEFSIGLLFVNVRPTIFVNLPVLMHGRIQVGLWSIYSPGNKLTIQYTLHSTASTVFAYMCNASSDDF